MSIGDQVNSPEQSTNTGRADADSIKAMAETLFITNNVLRTQLLSVLTNFGVTEEQVYSSDVTDEFFSQCPGVLARLKQIRTINYVVLYGGWSDVPPFKVDNPAIDLDDELFCLSDAPYGEVPNTNGATSSLPSVSVGRLPVLDSIRLEYVLSAKGPTVKQTDLVSYSVTAKCWLEPTKSVLEQIGVTNVPQFSADINDTFSGDCRVTSLVSPEWDDENLSKISSNRAVRPGSVLLFNVHGSPDDPVWVGEGEQFEYVPILRPGIIQDYTGVILVSEACYGGALEFDEPSIVEDFFNRGGLGFVGCSVIAFGAIDSNIAGADVLALATVQSLKLGKSIGQALIDAKFEVLQRSDDDPEIGLKTIHSFNLYGVPWRKISIENLDENLGSRNSTLNWREDLRARVNLHNRESADVLNRYRASYQPRLPENLRRKVLEDTESALAFRLFKDAVRIEETLNRWRSRYPIAKVLVPINPCEKDYRIICTSKTTNLKHDRRVIVLDGSGSIKKVIATKGAKK